jgi:hypothetical protein
MSAFGRKADSGRPVSKYRFMSKGGVRDAWNDGTLYRIDAESVQKLLEGLTFQASRLERQLSPTSECRCVGVAVA